MLANQHDTYHDIEGDAHYDSLTPEDITAHYRSDVQYSPEDGVDSHSDRRGNDPVRGQDSYPTYTSRRSN